MHKITSTLLFTAIINLSACGINNSQPSPAGSGDIPISTAPAYQGLPQLVTDSAGGAIIVWEDIGRISAQRLDSAGVRQWAANGITIGTTLGIQQNPQIVSDGTGGAIIVWTDNVNGITSIYVQRVNGNGTTQWTPGGIILNTSTGFIISQKIISDGIGGAIIVWTDGRNGNTNTDIYAQHVDSTGIVQWTANGEPICAATGGQGLPQITEDGTGGAIIVWEDGRNNAYEIYAQHISNTGFAQWTVGGVAITTAAAVMPHDPQLVSDNAGGAIIAWRDSRNAKTAIHSQRINNVGAAQWAVDGVAVSTGTIEDYPRLVADGTGGTIITWADMRNSVSNIYAQRIDKNGVTHWAVTDVAISNSISSAIMKTPYIAPDGVGGAFLAWDNSYINAQGLTSSQVYSQHINNAGVTQWAVGGIAVTTSASTRPHLISNGAGGAIYVWEDFRNGLEGDIYARIISANGT